MKIAEQIKSPSMDEKLNFIRNTIIAIAECELDKFLTWAEVKEIYLSNEYPTINEKINYILGI